MLLLICGVRPRCSDAYSCRDTCRKAIAASQAHTAKPTRRRFEPRCAARLVSGNRFTSSRTAYPTRRIAFVRGSSLKLFRKCTVSLTRDSTFADTSTGLLPTTSNGVRAGDFDLDLWPWTPALNAEPCVAAAACMEPSSAVMNYRQRRSLVIVRPR